MGVDEEEDNEDEENMKVGRRGNKKKEKKWKKKRKMENTCIGFDVVIKSVLMCRCCWPFTILNIARRSLSR